MLCYAACRNERWRVWNRRGRGRGDWKGDESWPEIEQVRLSVGILEEFRRKDVYAIMRLGGGELGVWVE
jgi:hypothetical protein